MNKPSTGDTPSTAPFESVSAGYLPLYGCVAGAEFYRVMASAAPGADGLTTPISFGPATPVIAAPWQVAPLSGPPSPPILPDANGWYPSTYLSYYPQNLLVNWNPPDGVYQLTVETGAGTPGNVTQTGYSSPPIQVVVDSSPPTVNFVPTGWKYAASTGGFIPFSVEDGCLVIERNGADIEIELSYGVTASHLYSVCLVPDGCGVGDVTVTDSGALVAGVAGCVGGLGYLYDGPTDNSLSGTVTYTIAGDAPDGCYSWTLWAYSRAFSPNESAGLTDVGGSAWNYEQTPIYRNPQLSIAIITQ